MSILSVIVLVATTVVPLYAVTLKSLAHSSKVGDHVIVIPATKFSCTLVKFNVTPVSLSNIPLLLLSVGLTYPVFIEGLSEIILYVPSNFQ